MEEDEEERLTEETEGAATAIELAILAVIAERLASIDDTITYVKSREWLAEDAAKIDKIIKRARELLKANSRDALHSIADAREADAAVFYEAKGIVQSAWKENQYLSHIVKASEGAVSSTVDRLVKTSVIELISSDGTYKPWAEVYKETCDMATRQILAGRYNKEAIADAVERIGSGVVAVRYRSGATRELYSAISQSVMDSYREASGAIQEQQAVEFGADGVRISAHGLCAPDHAPYQGRQYTFAEFNAIQNKLERPIGGWNCKHHTTKVIVGVGSKHSDEELRKIDRRSKRKVEFTGLDGVKREKTAYEFSQYQRQVETKIRRTKMTADTLMRAGNEEAARRLKARAKRLNSAYRQMSKQAGISTKPERTKVYNVIEVL